MLHLLQRLSGKADSAAVVATLRVLAAPLLLKVNKQHQSSTICRSTSTVDLLPDSDRLQLQLLVRACWVRTLWHQQCTSFRQCARKSLLLLLCFR
jgi:hypothetical protein